MTKLEITLIPTSLAVIKEAKTVDAFIIGQADYALRLPVYFTEDELNEAIKEIKANKQKVYIACNKIIHEFELNKIDNYLKKLANLNIDGIVFGDLAIYQMAEKYNLINKLIYNPETYMTNYETVAFFASLNLKRITLAKEITLADIILIGSKQLSEIAVLGHGAANMFHSKRDLITNYFNFNQKDNYNSFKNQEMFLIEEIRDEKYPIIEDQNGTHIFSSHDLCTINYLDCFIENNVTAIIIDGLFKTDTQLLNIVNVYQEAIADYYLDKTIYLNKKAIYLDKLKQINNIRPFDDGFLFKKTVYKGEQDDK